MKENYIELDSKNMRRMQAYPQMDAVLSFPVGISSFARLSDNINSSFSVNIFQR